MQFMPRTWDTYGVDGDGDGDRHLYDVEDAIHSRRELPPRPGAPRDWRAAIFAYNHADWYVAQVLRAAEALRRARGRDGRPVRAGRPPRARPRRAAV